MDRLNWNVMCWIIFFCISTGNLSRSLVADGVESLPSLFSLQFFTELREFPCKLGVESPVEFGLTAAHEPLDQAHVFVGDGRCESENFHA